MSAKTLSINSTLSLPNSQYKIPQIGFGVYLSPKDVCVASCKKAFEAGYRHIDTAQYYANEEQVGQALKESGLPREDVYITSKILSPGEDVESTYKKVAESVEKLAGKDGYADLFLIHSPNGGKEARKLMWLALKQAQEKGIVRDIGVSNYGIQHIDELASIDSKASLPAVNQIELHPWCQQREVVEYCKSKNIVVEAYCPIVRNEKANDATLASIAKKHNKEPNQVLIRWSLQKGYVPLPKSDTPSRIVGNADIYGFELDKEDMAKLDGLDQGAKGAIVQAVTNA
ncbi:NADP-dependent oxidoreductase domain-containing protein [Alternaria rosae]|uniref:NADP-dependent oxidoreductase domain-containing protein n=1 Tax=Alternaria rosae TaxID=1187941 RepID=UPI001E8E8231|nr:NADP-dependent oxidoreductase domain-containing protein [Alternaria rosae]KAH6866981.1 NADP-dependent oxidoreductase domain-containing protein [Alternaria rosae]